MKRRGPWRRLALPATLLGLVLGGVLAACGLGQWSAWPWRQAPERPAAARPPAALQAEFTARVVGVADGDSLTVRSGGREALRVRLAEIDAPELGQPHGEQSRQLLARLAAGRSVRVVVEDTDRYGRAVARVHLGTLDLNAEMVRQGGAWIYDRYSRDPALAALEEEARGRRRGLWALPEAERVPPWDWRARQRQ